MHVDVFALLIFILLYGYNKPPWEIFFEPEHTWLDKETQSDIIITGKGSIPEYLYFAAKNWQNSGDTKLAHGYRQIAVKFGDSILVKRLNDSSANYAGPFFFRMNMAKQLKAQNFLDTSFVSPSRVFVLK